MAQHLAVDMPTGYGDPVAELAALSSGAGLVDRSHVGRLRITGADALDLLNRLSTNKLESLPPGQGLPTVLTSPKGRVVDLLLVGAQQDHLLCLTSPSRQQAVADWIDFYTFGEEIFLQDLTPATSQFTVAGPSAASVLSSVGILAQELARYNLQNAEIEGSPVVVWRTLSAGVESFEVIVSQELGVGVWRALMGAGAAPAGREAWEAFRIANGAPAYGTEHGDETNPLESRLRGAISFSKGCYTGQEVVARLDTYQKVQRQLMSARLTSPASPGDVLWAEGQKAGVLTSVATLPTAGGHAALAFVDMKYAVPGRALDLPSGATATITDPAYAVATEPPPTR